MKVASILVAAVLAGAITGACMAQEEEEDGPKAYTYATYMYCKLSEQDDADEHAKEIQAPVYNQLVEDGVISAWGWLAHHTGGRWRRLFYFQHETLDGLLDGLDALQERMAALPEEDQEAGENLCQAHDDYIWTVESSSQEPGEGRADAGISVYYVCDESREERADEIVESTIGPLFSAFVTDVVHRYGAGGRGGWAKSVYLRHLHVLQTQRARRCGRACEGDTSTCL